MSKHRFILLLFPVLQVLTSTVSAHELRPAYLEINEQGNNQLTIEFRQPVGPAQPVYLSVQLNCKTVTDKIHRRTVEVMIENWSVQCDPAVARSLSIQGLNRTVTDVLVRFEPLVGEGRNHTLSYGNPTLLLESTSQPLVPVYLVLGIEHLLLGLDHVLFVIGLMLLIENRVLLIQTITSFTIAHSLSLALSTLGLVHVSQRPVEAVIALSLLYIAVEVVNKKNSETLTQRYPWIITFAFGLLHGLGFAGVLSEIGLPSNEAGWALLFFNIGIELGQLVVIGLAFVLGIIVSNKRTNPWPVARLSIVPAYGIGIISTWWLLTRVTSIIA